MINKGLFSSNSNEYATPQDFFDELNNEFNFTLDPCSTDENAKCKKHFTIKENGLIQSWKDERAFVNPPYGREIKSWVKKASDEVLVGGVSACGYADTSENRHNIFS